MRLSSFFRILIVLSTSILLFFLFYFVKKNEFKGRGRVVSIKKLKKISSKSHKIKVKPLKKIGPIYVNKFDILRFRRDEPYIFLTFDGCSLNNCVKPILRILKEKKVDATFFLNGTFMRKYPEDTRLISSSSFAEVGSHLYRHIHLTEWENLHRQITRKNISKSFFQNLLIKNENLYYKLTGKKMDKIWRAPYGETNLELDSWANELGYYHISWTRDYKFKENLDTLDWLSDRNDKRFKTNIEILNMLINFGRNRSYGLNGGIILFHLGSKRKIPAYEILPEFIDKMRGRGYEFKRVGFGLKNLNN